MELGVRFCLLKVTLNFVGIWSWETTISFILASSLNLGLLGNARSYSLAEFDALIDVSRMVWLVSLWAYCLLHIVLFVLSLPSLVLV